MAEAFGVQGRGGFYEEVGAIRDVVQNHFMQVVGFLAMEPPATTYTESIRDELVKVFRQIKPLESGELVCGQFQGYREEAGELSFFHHPLSDEMDAYERLLGDAMHGDATLFSRQDAIEAAWAVVDPVLGDVMPVHLYEPGTWGPAVADRLTADVGGWAEPSGSP